MKLCAQLQRGFAAIAAIFLVVILAALGAFMVTFSNTQQITSAQDLQGSRAYWAANSGLEWGLSSVTTNMACASAELPLDYGFTASVTCVSAKFNEAGLDKSIFIVKSVARNSNPPKPGSLGYVERSLSASIEK